MNIIITGGHSGIGLELTKKLITEGHNLGLIVRSLSRTEKLPEVVKNYGHISYFEADLSSQKSVLEVAQNIASQWNKVDVLYNNAGVLLDANYDSPQGNELHLEVNTLAPVILSHALKPLLDKSDQPTIVNTVTGGLHQQRKLDTSTLINPTKFTKLLGAYLQSKLALTIWMSELSKEWSNIKIVSVDPGPNKTKMTKGSGMPNWLKPLRNLIFAKPSKGGNLLFQGAFDKRHADKSGVYLSGNKVKAMKMTLSDEHRALLEEGIKVDL
jgi:NAD(P)-dependent dehydrogenase (short-subunit alcohol dehydrogenase family)